MISITKVLMFVGMVVFCITVWYTLLSLIDWWVR